jgi:hypothetical protein
LLVSRRALPLVLALLLAACASTSPPGQAQQFANGATAAPRATATALATEPTPSKAPRSTPKPTAKPTAKPTPKPTPRSTPKPTAKPASYYKPPGWDGYSDVDCRDFDTHAHAQSFFKGTGGSSTNDPYRLDRDHDGIACETLP